MELPFAISNEEAYASLRAMATCARADGELSAIEEDTLRVAAKLLGVSCDPDHLADIPVDELARVFPEPARRERVVQAMILMALMDGDVTQAEVALARTYASELGVDEPRVANLGHVAEGRLRTLWLDLARRSFARPIFERTLREKGPMGVWKIVGPMVGLAQDPTLARKYIALGELPEGTFGRAYFRFIVENELGFPGEGIVAEEGVWHDLAHVLAGYDTTPHGEVSVVSFIAGTAREDPFFWLFSIALQFHLAIRVSPYSEGATGHFLPEVVAPALLRGLRVTKDLSRAWDPFPHFARPLRDVRAELGVPPP